MGYYTRYSLVVRNDSNQIVYEPIVNLREFDDNAQYAINDDGSSEESCKWYDRDMILRKFSKKYPDHIFALSGEGAESGDLWVEYYRNGLMQRCNAIITFDPFDEGKLS